MGFLAPAWLGLAALAAVPLLLHVLRQRAGARIEFPAVRWLVSAEQEASRDLRLRQLLVLLLRILAIVAIALAAARPTLPLAGGPPRALAIVLDDSPSTGATVGGRPVYDALRAEARALRDAGLERLWLVTTDGRVHTAPAALDSVLARERPARAASDLAGAVRRAVALARAAGRDAAVAVLTDGQASAWRDSIDARGVRVVVHVPPGTPAPNAAVASLRAVPVRWNPRGQLEASLRFAAESLAWTASIGDAVVARGTARRPADDSTTLLRIPLVAPDTGWATAKVAIVPDALDADDEALAAVHVAPPATVRAAAGPYVDAAVAVLADAGRVRTTGGGPTVRIGPPDATTTLPAVLTLPSEPGALAGANAVLARLGVPFRFGAPAATDAVVAARDESLRGDTAVRAVRVAPLVAAVPGAPGDTLATVGRAPLVVAGEGWVLVGAALDPAFLTLPVRASFVPWLLEAIDRAGGGGSSPRVVPAGTALRPPVPGAVLRDASGAAVVPADRAPALPGVYRWTTDSARVRGVVVVQRDAGESALARAPLPAIAAALGDDAAHVVTADAAAWRAAIRRAGNSRPLVLPFLALALACLLLESRLSRAPGRAVRTPSPVPA